MQIFEVSHKIFEVRSQYYNTAIKIEALKYFVTCTYSLM